MSCPSKIQAQIQSVMHNLFTVWIFLKIRNQPHLSEERWLRGRSRRVWNVTIVGHLPYDHCDAEEMDCRDLPTVNLDHGMTNMNNEGVLILCHLVFLILLGVLSVCSFHMLVLQHSLSSDWKHSSMFFLPSFPYLHVAISYSWEPAATFMSPTVHSLWQLVGMLYSAVAQCYLKVSYGIP